MGNQRIIKIENNYFFLTPDYRLPVSATNLPSSLGFRTHKSQYWLVEILEFHRKTQTVNFRIIDYYPPEYSEFESQKIKAEVARIIFKDLEWRYLEPQLSHYRKKDLTNIIIDSEETYLPDQSHKEFNFLYKLPFKEMHFGLGFFSSQIFIESLQKEYEIRIENPHIIPEFEFIKSFFQKKFKKKNARVEVVLQFEGEHLKRIDAYSEDLDKIDASFIDTIKHQRTLALTKPPLIKTVDKSLFSSEDIFDEFSEEESGNVFEQSATDILKLLTEAGAIRNRKQLEYLAGLKQSEDFKIHFTLNPMMGFLFLIPGEKMHHFCWELLNSHATYLWSFYSTDISADDAFAQVERTIGMIRDHGRERYKSAYRSGSIESDLVFHYLIHRDADSKVKDPFPRWRQKLEERLI